MKRCAAGSFGRLGLALVAALALVACSGENERLPSYSVGGTVSGLDGTVALQNNGTDDLSVTQSGGFTFATAIKRGQQYSVAVSTQPATQHCTVANGTGVAADNVTNVLVNCIDTNIPTYTIGGFALGVRGVVVLRNGPELLPVSGPGAFTFKTRVVSGTSYSVSVETQPDNQECTVSNGSGTVGTADVTDIVVTCADIEPSTYTIGGTVSGLSGEVTLRNGNENLNVTSNGAFTFGTRVPSGTSYDVSVTKQPTQQTCTVSNGSGTVGTANVTNVTVTCTDDGPPQGQSYSIGGTVSGLHDDLMLRNGNENLRIDTNGPFTFGDELQTGATYDVSVTKQPSGQTCTVTNGSGTVGTADVTDIRVECADDAASVTNYSIGGDVSGLQGGTLRLGLQHAGSSGSAIDVTTNGAFSFEPDRVPQGGSYAVSIVTQPDGQQCTVTNGSGTATANVTNVQVDCAQTTTGYEVGGHVTGLSGAGLVLEGGTGNVARPDSGADSFTLPEAFADGDVYDVGVAAQPAGQTCVITHGHGAVAGADVTSIEVSCLDNVTDPIVGTYAVTQPGIDGIAYLTLFAEGVYVYGGVENDPGCGGGLDGNGVEYGVYTYDAGSGTFTIRNAVVDTNGGCGVWDGASRLSGSLSASQGGKDKSLALDVPGRGSFELVPVESKNDQLYGSFADPYHRNFWLFTDAGAGSVVVFDTQTQADDAATSLGHRAGVELACATIDGSSGQGTLLAEFSPNCQAGAPVQDGAVDTNGSAGLSQVAGPVAFDVNGDDLVIDGVFRGRRIDPR